MAKAERSAGFVIYYQPGAGLDGLEFLLLDSGGHWDFPKGHLKGGEDDFAAALRELHEETGLVPTHVRSSFQQETSYFFRHKRHGLVRKTVLFFLGQVETRVVRISKEHIGFVFLSYDDAMDKLTYPNAKQVLKAAWEKLHSK